MRTVAEVVSAARRASTVAGGMSREARDDALRAMASSLRSATQSILLANERDMRSAREKGMSDALLDRLELTAERIDAMAAGLESVADLDDPLGRVLEDRTLDNGLNIRRITVPLGVVAMIYEARPNVTSDAAGLCVKSGNAVVLRGGAAAYHTNTLLAHLLDRAASTVGFAEHTVSLIEGTDHADVDELLHMRGFIDVVIPRGGAGLISHCVEHSDVPVIETGIGNCHIYVHADADFDMAARIVMNAKCQRPGVCNACESMLVDASIAADFLPSMIAELHEAGVRIHGDDVVRDLARQAGIEVATATEDDWGREYLAPEISIHVVEGIDRAIEHIARYGTGHSECIVTRDTAAGERFLSAVDAAAVYVNASTRFTDGGCFGLGAEIGISTQKLHARGPFALDALCSYKYIVHGTGQVRS